MIQSVGPSAAIAAIQRSRAVRIYAETPSLTLLGIEDELSARVQWRERLGKAQIEQDQKTWDAARNEIAKRPTSELETAREEFQRRNKIWSYFPDEGPLRRELYVKHMDFVEYTREDDEVMFLAGNKVGKSDLGGFCVATWATGRYPHWWTGRVFEGPVTFWIVNKTAKDVRDINEAVLLGPPGNEAERGTGMIPSHLIQKCTPKPGTPNGFEFINVRHVSGGTSYIQSKSYDQGREAFQGRNITGIWNDEEVPKDVADEERLRIMTTGGLILYTYTPINGLTEMTMNFMESAGLSIEAMRHVAAEEEVPV